MKNKIKVYKPKWDVIVTPRKDEIEISWSDLNKNNEKEKYISFQSLADFIELSHVLKLAEKKYKAKSNK